MSANNFWNSFKNGFSLGMLFNSPMFSCFNGFSGVGNWFGGMSLFGGFCGFNNCFFNNYWNNTSLFMVPNAFTSNFYQVMPDLTPPSVNFNFDASKLFDNSHIWDNVQCSNTQMPINSALETNFSNYDVWKSPSWESDWTQKSSLSATDSNITISYDATELKKTWSKKKSGLSNAFYNKVIDIAKKVKCSPNDLMALMYSECSLNPAKVNSSSQATGLIQFMPKTAKSLGTSVEALRKMPAEQQLQYVEKYLVAQKKTAGFSNDTTLDAGTLYALTYLPKYAKQEVLATKANDSKGHYSQNKGLDANKDGKITKTELGNRLKSYYA